MFLPLVACSRKLAIEPARVVVSERASPLARSRSAALDFLPVVWYALKKNSISYYDGFSPCIASSF